MALSRVRMRDHIRLLLRNRDRSTMDYISDLKKKHYTKCYFEGYVPYLGDLAISADRSTTSATEGQHLMTWNSRLAATKAEFIAPTDNATANSA